MSDSRQRELEHSWKQTGSEEEEAAFLLERVRAGDLELRELELAAFVGHAAAVVATTTPAPQFGSDLANWAEALAQFGKEACARTAICVTWISYEALELGLPDDALSAAEAWAACPCLEHERAADLNPDEADIRTDQSEEAANVVAALEEDDSYGPGFYLSCCLDHVPKERLPEARDRIRSELSSWALGSGDPVRARVKARQMKVADG